MIAADLIPGEIAVGHFAPLANEAAGGARPMVGVTPHADEIAEGVLGRLSVLNEFVDGGACFNAMRRDFEISGMGPSRAPALHVLAKFSRMDPRSFEQLHSMLPFTRFAVKQGSRTSDGGWATGLSASAGSLIPRDSAYFCPACVRLDLELRGYSYWRRAHQLPSAFWCDKHQHERLHFVAAPFSFDRSPEYWIDSGESEPQDMPEEIRDHAALRAFAEACQKMLDGGSSRDVQRVRKALSDRAQLNGFATGGGYLSRSRRARLSDLVQERLPRELLQALFPNSEHEAPRGLHDEIDGAVHSRNVDPLPLATALAISLLYPSVPAAFIDIEGTNQFLTPKAVKLAIAEVFIQTDGDIAVIAERLKLTVANAMSAMILHRGAIQRAIDLHPAGLAVKDFYEEKSLTLQDACNRRGASPKLVERALWLKGASDRNRARYLAPEST